MENNKPSMFDLLIENHICLERQGPGSAKMTQKALSFIEDVKQITRGADLGCGSGGQTMILAQQLDAEIIGLDLFPEFIDVFNENAKKQNFGERVKGVVGSMDNLPFEKEAFDLIWSEGAIDNIGFEKGLAHWYEFLKKNGYVAVTCPSWLTAERPLAVEKFWSDAGSSLDAVEHNIGIMQKCGYQFIASFTLPETCWTDNYYIPREAELKRLLEKYPQNQTMEAFAAGSREEVELYSKYKQYYGYVFYIGKKI